MGPESPSRLILILPLSSFLSFIILFPPPSFFLPLPLSSSFLLPLSSFLSFYHPLSSSLFLPSSPFIILFPLPSFLLPLLLSSSFLLPLSSFLSFSIYPFLNFFLNHLFLS